MSNYISACYEGVIWQLRAQGYAEMICLSWVCGYSRKPNSNNFIRGGTPTGAACADATSPFAAAWGAATPRQEEHVSVFGGIAAKN
jgi:hypothetical protein